MVRKSISDLIDEDTPVVVPPIPTRIAPDETKRPDAVTPDHHDVATPERHEGTTSELHEATASELHELTTQVRRDVTTPLLHEVTTPRRSSTRTPRRRRATTSRRQAPSVEESVAMTVRFDPEEFDEIDEWIRGLRREMGFSKLDKSEVVRALIDVAREKPAVRRLLIAILTA